MVFARLAPAGLLAAALILLLFPWFPKYSGFRVCLYFFEEPQNFNEPIVASLFVLLALHPLSLLVGIIASLATLPSTRRSVFVGIMALYSLTTLTVLYLLVLNMGRSGIKEMRAPFYLSHAVALACVILCVREYKRSS